MDCVREEHLLSTWTMYIVVISGCPSQAPSMSTKCDRGNCCMRQPLAYPRPRTPLPPAGAFILASRQV